MKTRKTKSWRILASSLFLFYLAAPNSLGRCDDLRITHEPGSGTWLDGGFIGRSGAAEELEVDALNGAAMEIQIKKTQELKRKEAIRLASRKIRVVFSKLSDPRHITDSIEHRIKIIRKKDDKVIEEFSGEGGFYGFFVDLDPAQYVVIYCLNVKIKDKYYQERLEQVHRGKIRRAWSDIVVDETINIKGKPGCKYLISHRISITEGLVPYGIKADKIKVKTIPDFFK